MEDKLFGMLGIARRAGKITFGFDAVVRSVTEGTAFLVLMSQDVAERTERQTIRACDENSVKAMKTKKSMLDIGYAIGRGSTAVLSVTDSSIAAKLEELCRDKGEERTDYDDKVQGS
ncbi:MAG TPA: ribosomal L7Ae/L30e/S12e/Gadd45 family protein [Clostridia bacterium]|nr:ribosomal L7Ae/L30e/S12e/Gadd45 family protein [Clostridia bacterium]